MESGDADTCIDVTLATPDLVPETVRKLLPLLGSDHRPVLIKLLKPQTKLKRKPSGKFNYDTRGDDIVSKLRTDKVARPPSKGPNAISSWLENERVKNAWETKLEASKLYAEAKRSNLCTSMRPQPKRNAKQPGNNFVSPVTPEINQALAKFGS